MNFSLIRIATLCLLFILPFATFAQPGNNTVAMASDITPVTTCGATSGQTLYLATSDGISSTSCGSGTRRDVWYKFTTPMYVSSVSIQVSLPGSSLTASNTFIEAYNADEDAEVVQANSIGCSNIGAALNLTGLSQNRVYYFRVFTTTNPTTGSNTNWAFRICVSYTATTAPSNNECSGATVLGIGSASSGTLWGATASSGIPAGCVSGTPDDDVWYRFTATSANVNVALSSIGSNLSAAGAMLQLFGGSCGALTSVACGYKNLSASGLTVGSTYYIRVYSSDAGSIGGTSAGANFSITVSNQAAVSSSTVNFSGRMNEVFRQTIISPANALSDPWEVTYGSDGYLWITEAKGYRVFRMDPVTGLKSTILDISQNSTFLPSAERTFNLQFDINSRSFQGGLAGLALHPDWATKKYVYISYGHTYNSSATGSAGIFFTNRIVRFTYNPTTNRLESPVSLCDTLPGSSDHNSQRMIIAPVGGTNYLFYAAGDMGAGQFGNAARPIKSQINSAYEGKILRFNLEPDGDAGTLDRWIPNDNPYNTTSPAKQNAVWCTGIRNNQGFAYGNGKLYGSSHGPYSDDELNILERDKNYGHPIVIGYAADNNYNNSKAGHNNGSDATIMPLISNESGNAAGISNYADPIFSAYAPSQTTVNGIYTNPVNNAAWPSEGWSGMDIYTNTVIPGWKNSLVLAALKWGRLMRLKLNNLGTAVIKTAGHDTVSYFDGQNRFRDIAFSPDGRDIFVVMDRSTASSGPTQNNPAVVTCAGCVFKYTFLGYNDVGGKSSIHSTIDVTSGTVNAVNQGTTITINSTNNNLWVPITGPDGNILAEIKANGNNLGTVTSSFFISSSNREDASKKLYLNRSITITPQNQPSTPVSVRFYLSSNELEALKNATNTQNLPSQVTAIGDVKIRKNNDTSPNALTATTTTINPIHAETHGSNGYVLQADISSFSTFYFGNPDMTTLPLMLVEFKGTLKNGASLLQWKTEHEINTYQFIVERSVDGRNFKEIGTVAASGTGDMNYSYTDHDAINQFADLIYYRLRMVDMDGQFSYSKVISIAYPLVGSTIVYPNPIDDALNLRLSLAKSENIHIQVSDMEGRIVYRQTKQVTAGTNDIKINTKKWPSQTYSVRVVNSKGKVLLTKQVIKM